MSLTTSRGNKNKISLETFLKAHTITKDEAKALGKKITHTEFGAYSKRSFHIPLEKEKDFEEIYYQEIIKPNKNHHIIERQIIKDEKTAGPILVDIDFRFAPENTDRVYSFHEHIQPFLQAYLGEITKIFEMEEDVKIPVFVLEKPAPRNVIKNGESIVHDGFHVLIGLAADQMVQEWIRKQMVEILQEIWENLPIVNKGGWEDVFDNSIPSGTNGWLKYGSKKAEDISAYKITHAFECMYDFDVANWNVEILSLENEPKFLETYYRQLSARYRDFPKLFCKEEPLLAIQKAFENSTVKAGTGTTVGHPAMNGEKARIDETLTYIPIETLRQIDSPEKLQLCLISFLDNLSPADYELRETYEYTMILPESYYGSGSYNKWIKVGFALKNISNRLLIVFLAFSAKFPGFQYSTQIPDICDRWEKFSSVLSNGIGQGVTKKSIMYWAKNDALDKYDKVRENTIDYYMEQTIETITLEQLNNPKKKNAKGCTDYDIATLLYRLCCDEFVSVSIRGNEWYHFHNHRWIKNDSGTTLRNRISTGLRDLYQNKAKELLNRAIEFEQDSEQYKLIYGRASKVMEIAFLLGSTKDKDNIMKEAKELFYNPDFLDKLDQNKYLMCFKNGVVDFKNCIFRKGYPEDYISKCTETDFIALNREMPSVQMKIQEIEEYMSQLFPEKELCQYVWNHLASCLIGDTALNQCLHYYTGCGQNGKSMLVKLMQLILGGYSGELSVGFYTQERSKMGQSTPELFSIMGVRYAITSEPSEGDKLNEGPMKQLTSGTDPMSCRAPYGQLMKFIPQANAIIMANHFLEIKSRDHGTWRRVRVIEFKSLFTDTPVKGDKYKPYQFKKVDNLDIKFDEWKETFMGMLIALAFKTQGVCKICPLVSAASDQYRQNQDFLAEFIHDKIMKREGSTVKKGELNGEFKDWYNLNYGYSKLNKTKELHGCMDKLFGNYTEQGWKGVALVYDHDDNSSRFTGSMSGASGTDAEEDDQSASSSRKFAGL